MHRFDLQDWQWDLIAELFPANAGKEGGQWKDHRTVLNGMFFVLHTGAGWRDLPERYGAWQTAWGRFDRYRRNGTFDLILRRLRARLDRLGRVDWDYWCFDECRSWRRQPFRSSGCLRTSVTRDDAGQRPASVLAAGTTCGPRPAAAQNAGPCLRRSRPFDGDRYAR